MFPIPAEIRGKVVEVRVWARAASPTRTPAPLVEEGSRLVQIGDTAVYAFRAQIFVTRSHVAVATGLRDGRPELVGTFTALGERVTCRGLEPEGVWPSSR